MSFTLADTTRINWPSANEPSPSDLIGVPSEMIGLNEFKDGYAFRNTLGRTFLVIERPIDNDIQIVDPVLVAAIREQLFLSPTVIVEDVTISRPISSADGAAITSLHAEGVYILTNINRLSNLTTLRIPNSPLSSIEPLRGLINLTTIDLYATPNLQDLTPLLDLPALQYLNIESKMLSDQNLVTLNTLYNRGVAIKADVPIAGVVARRSTIALTPSGSMTIELLTSPATGIQTARIYPPIIETPTSYDIFRSNGNPLLSITATPNTTHYDIPRAQTLYILNNDSTIKFITVESPSGAATGDLEQINNGSTVLNPARPLLTGNSTFLTAVKASMFTPNVPHLDELTNLKSLDISQASLTDITGIENFTSLEHLDMSFNPDLTNPEAIAVLTTLLTLNAAYANIDDPAFLIALTLLTFANIEGCTIPYAVEGLTVLQDVDINNVQDLILDPAFLIPPTETPTATLEVYTRYLNHEFSVFMRLATDAAPDSIDIRAGETCDNAGDLILSLENITYGSTPLTYAIVSHVITCTKTSHGLTSGDALYFDSSPFNGYFTVTTLTADTFTVDYVGEALSNATGSANFTKVNLLTKEQLQSLYLPSIYIEAPLIGRYNMTIDLPTHRWAFTNESLLAANEKVLSVSEETGTIQTDFVFNPFVSYYYMGLRIIHTVQDPTAGGIYNRDTDFLLYNFGAGSGEISGTIPDPDNIGDFIDRYTYTEDAVLTKGDLYLMSEQGRLPVYYNVLSTDYAAGEICSERRDSYDELEESLPLTVKIHTNYSLEGFKLDDLDIVMSPGDPIKMIGPFSNKFNFPGTANSVPVTNLLNISFKALNSQINGIIKIAAFVLDPSGAL